MCDFFEIFHGCLTRVSSVLIFHFQYFTSNVDFTIVIDPKYEKIESQNTIVKKSALDPTKKSQKNHTHQKYTQKHILGRKFENIHFLIPLSRILYFFTQNASQITIVN